MSVVLQAVGGPRRYRGAAAPMLVVAIVSAVLATGLAGTPVAAQSFTNAELDRAVDARSQYGFESGRSFVSSLASRKLSPTSDEYGFPMTPAEARDLAERSTFVQRLDKTTLPHLRGLAGYAGEWIDQQDGGRLVVGLTKATSRLKTSVRSHMPSVSRGVRFKEVNDSARALAAGLRRAETAWQELEPGIQPQAFAVHYRYNRITVKVRQHELERARALKSKLKAKLGVDVGFIASPAIEDLAPSSACSSRFRCYGPFRLGVRVNFPRSYPNARIKSFCGMGFHIKDPRFGGKHRSFMTAGHCTYDRKQPWHHHDDYRARYGKIGERVASKYTSEQRDIALIRIEDWNANRTTRIYGDNGWSNGARLTAEGRVIEGETLCMSLARTNKIWCGVADATDQWWTSTTATPNIRVRGAAIDFPGVPGRGPSGGDSGSPIYRRWMTATNSPQPRRTPIGIVNAGSADTPKQQEQHAIYFAPVWWALNDPDGWPDLEIYTAPPPPLPKRAFTATWIGTGRNDHRTSFEAQPAENASSYRWDFGDGTKVKFGRKATHRYKKAGEYSVKLTVGFPGGFKRSRSLRIAANPARTYAPMVYLHPQEASLPISADAFIEHSDLLFAHDGGCAASSIESGAVSAARLGNGEYQGRAADDADCSLVPPPYASNQNTRPGDPGTVLPAGEQEEGFYLDLENGRRAGTAPGQTPAYYEFRSGRYIIYWFFYAYNDHDNRHEGDWEHIAVRLNDTELGVGFAYYRHQCAVQTFERSRLEKGFGQFSTGFFGKTHPIVYSAEGSHASYWKRRPDWRIDSGCGLPSSFGPDRTQKGTAWKTWQTLQNARAGWYGYGGAWGPQGPVVAGKRVNDGPLGPSAHKLPASVPGWW